MEEALRFRKELATRGFNFGGYMINRVHQALPAANATPQEIADALVTGPFSGETPTGRMHVADALLAGLEAHNHLAEMDAAVIDRLRLVDEATLYRVPLQTDEIRDLRGLASVARSIAG